MNDDPNSGCIGCILWFLFWGVLIYVVTQVIL